MSLPRTFAGGGKGKPCEGLSLSLKFNEFVLFFAPNLMAIFSCGLHVCRADIDECANDKCHGRNECKNGINQFECICSDGWQGGGINSTCEGMPLKGLKFIHLLIYILRI